MPKRPLDVENKENEPPGQSLPSIIPGSSLLLKPVDTNEPTPAKRAKMNDTEIVQESDSSSDEEEEDDEEEKGAWTISSVIENNDGKIHPTNKQYFLYENTQPTIISRTARFWSRKYLKVLRHVDPDAYDLYIHNDFICYGELEIIENCLIDIAKGTFLKHKNHMNFTHYITAFRRLEALTILLDCSNNFVGIDDGDRFVEIIRVIGACYVSILSGLLPKPMLDNGILTNDDIKKLNKISQQLPNFIEVIQRALILGRMFLSIGFIPSAYTKILQTVYCNWLLIMNKIRINLNEKPDKKDEDIWEALKHAAGIKTNAYNESFNFLKELELYSKKNPDSGGNSHDLRKWSKTRRNLYSFDNTDNDDDDSEHDGNFWSRL